MERLSESYRRGKTDGIRVEVNSPKVDLRGFAVEYCRQRGGINDLRHDETTTKVPTLLATDDTRGFMARLTVRLLSLAARRSRQRVRAVSGDQPRQRPKVRRMFAITVI